MKSSLFALSLASSAAAQVMSFPADAVIAAVDPSDPEYTACEQVIDVLNVCITSAGGSDALETADPTKLVQCACCSSGNAISPAYSSCSTYLKKEGGLAGSSQASAYGTLYGICSMTNCAGGSGGSTPRTLSSPANTATPTATPTAVRTGSGSQSTSMAAVTSYPDACLDLVGIMTSCQGKTPGFTDLGYKQQASCYCCRRNPQGTSTFNDAFDQFASTCAVWAESGDPKIYGAASMYSTLCDNFSDVCKGAATATPSSASGSRTTSRGSDSGTPASATAGDVTVTVTPPPNGAAGLRITIGAVVGAVAAFAIAF